MNSSPGLSHKKNPQPTWDLFVRLSHWCIALGFLANFFLLEDDWHEYMGYSIAVLLLLRWVWGFVGGRFARFSQFLPTLWHVPSYTKSILQGRPAHYEGHTPLGTCMILTLWIGLLGLAVTGWMQTLDAFWGEEWLESLHALFANIMLGLVCIHVIAVIVVGRLEKINLVKAMITGHKLQPPKPPSMK